jgi:hypothetical protein
MYRILIPALVISIFWLTGCGTTDTQKAVSFPQADMPEFDQVYGEHNPFMIGGWGGT